VGSIGFGVASLWSNVHWRRLVKNIMGKPKYWVEKVVITDESIGVSQLLGARVRAAPKFYAYGNAYCLDHVLIPIFKTVLHFRSGVGSAHWWSD